MRRLRLAPPHATAFFRCLSSVVYFYYTCSASGMRVPGYSQYARLYSSCRSKENGAENGILAHVFDMVVIIT